MPSTNRLDDFPDDPAGAAGNDPIHYLVSDDMAESGLQFMVIHLLVELLRFFFERDRRTMLVAGNQFIHYRQGDDQANLAPDVYVVADESTPLDEVRAWKTWEHGGKGPCLAIEVVSDEPKEARKDYAPEMIEKYEAMGVTELLRYDPHYGPKRHVQGQGRKLLTHWVRGEDGRLHEQPMTQADRSQSTQFGFWLVCRWWPRRLGLGTGPEGESRWPTRQEWEAQRAEEQSRLAAEESQRADEEARRADEAEQRLEAALSELAALRAAQQGATAPAGGDQPAS